MNLRDTLLIILVNLVWGLNFIAMVYSLESFPPIFANGLRFGIALLLLSPFLKVVRGQMGTLLFTALLLGVFHFGAMMVAMSQADDIGPIAIAGQLNVPFATILAVFWLKEKVGWRRVAAITVSFIGVLVIGFDPKVFGYISGVLLMVLAAFLYALSTVFLRRLYAVPALTTQAWVCVAGLIGSLVISAVFENGQMGAFETAETAAYLGLLYSAVGSTIIGHGGTTYLLRKYEVSVITPYFLLMPVFAVMGSVMIMGEAITGRMLLGGGLTLLGVAIITLRNNKRQIRGENKKVMHDA